MHKCFVVGLKNLEEFCWELSLQGRPNVSFDVVLTSSINPTMLH